MIKEILLDNNGSSVTIKIIRSSRKTSGLEVRSAEEVVLRIPSRLPDKHIRQFVSGHESWIKSKCALVSEKKGAMPDRIPPGESANIRRKFMERISHFSALMGEEPNRIAIRNQKTKWGSCSSKRNLNFNFKLYYLPDELMDYVIVHELAHLKHMNHSPQFWAEVEKYCPGYRQCRKELKKVCISLR